MIVFYAYFLWNQRSLLIFNKSLNITERGGKKVIFNRVTKTGSNALLSVISILSEQNNFTTISNNDIDYNFHQYLFYKEEREKFLELIGGRHTSNNSQYRNVHISNKTGENIFI